MSENQCKILKDTYERYKTGVIKKIEQLKLGSFDSDYILNSIFGMSKFGSEYYHKCEDNIEKSIILGDIARKTIKLVENDIIFKNTMTLRGLLSKIGKDIKSTEQLEKEHNLLIKKIQKDYDKL